MIIIIIIILKINNFFMAEFRSIVGPTWIRIKTQCYVINFEEETFLE